MPNSIPREAFEIHRQAADKFVALVADTLPRVNTMIHQDARLDNMILGPDEVLFLDWQQ